MEQKELERELMELCERVSGAKARYTAHSAVEDTIRSVSGYNSGEAKPYREAKELLADKVREQALSEDLLWRALIIGAAQRIMEMHNHEMQVLKATFGSPSQFDPERGQR